MSDFGLLKSFDIDNGELEDLSRQQCFVLGYELAQIDFLLTGDDEINKPFNADNRIRIEAACRDSKRQFRIQWLPGDVSESWMQLHVPPRDRSAHR